MRYDYRTLQECHCSSKICQVHVPGGAFLKELAEMIPIRLWAILPMKSGRAGYISSCICNVYEMGMWGEYHRDCCLSLVPWNHITLFLLRCFCASQIWWLLTRSTNSPKGNFWYLYVPPKSSISLYIHYDNFPEKITKIHTNKQ